MPLFCNVNHFDLAVLQESFFLLSSLGACLYPQCDEVGDEKVTAGGYLRSLNKTSYNHCLFCHMLPRDVPYFVVVTTIVS